MPHRVYHLLWGAFGLLLVLALLFVRADLGRHSLAGPRWKRRLVSAGLMLLGALGYGAMGAASGCARNVLATAGADGGTGGAGSAQGGGGGGAARGGGGGGGGSGGRRQDDVEARIARVTREAEEIVAGKRGSYPFDRAGQKRLLDSLREAGRDVERLRAAGRIHAGEAGLWQADLEQLALGVSAFRPTEMSAATCYAPQPQPVRARESLARLQRRLPALEKLAAAERLDPEVTRRVLRQIEADLEVLCSETERKRLPSAEQHKAREAAAAVRAHVERVRARLSPPAGAATSARLESEPGWRLVREALETLAPLAANSSAGTVAQRQAADAKLKAARAALGALVQAGALGADEARLLELEGDRLRAAMLSEPPSDEAVRCYRRAYLPPARQSLSRLRERLPILARLAASGRVTPAVLDRVLPAVERDLATTGDPSELQALQPAERADARKAAAEARRILDQLRPPPR